MKCDVFDESRWGTPVLAKLPNNEEDPDTRPDDVKEDSFE